MIRVNIQGIRCFHCRGAITAEPNKILLYCSDECADAARVHIRKAISDGVKKAIEPPKPVAPLNVIRNEDDGGPFCPKCGSTLKNKFF